jgi:hypothetical protein
MSSPRTLLSVPPTHSVQTSMQSQTALILRLTKSRSLLHQRIEVALLRRRFLPRRFHGGKLLCEPAGVAFQQRGDKLCVG